ncbi:hypothetical protein HHL22_07565 [Hymenobacter sp. RP-2-7]|uniref:Uncharacterized protein n=1 Tax=Hymenobacter polaris TaxID=2682546 RepID=A0A7Y0AD16_9BACT|nr:hypothetical protein [Hymenobacter polaris]NML65061.1 hypothetical protein [Hymenobacter polaris]
MKKLLLTAVMALSLGAAEQAHAQLGNLVGAGLVLGVGAIKRARMTPEQRAAEQQATQQKAAEKAAQQASVQQASAAATVAPAVALTELRPQRTATDKLPKKGAEQITALEAQLEQCRLAMQASPTGVVCTPAQRTAIQQAAVSAARANPSWSLQPYQQEMAFYAAEDARRQQPAAPPAK